jgi:hypothetical protein
MNGPLISHIFSGCGGQTTKRARSGGRLDTRRRRGFASLEALFEFLQAEVAPSPERDGDSSEIEA